MFACVQLIATMPTIHGMSIPTAMSTTTTRLMRIVSLRLCYHFELHGYSVGMVYQYVKTQGAEIPG